MPKLIDANIPVQINAARLSLILAFTEEHSKNYTLSFSDKRLSASIDQIKTAREDLILKYL